MLVVGRVALALRRADRALLKARDNLRPHGRGDVLGLAAEQARRRIADVGAIQAEVEAAAHLGDVALRKVRIGAGGAALQAGEALVDAAGEQVPVELGGQRVRLQHLLGRRHGPDTTPPGWAISFRPRTRLMG